MKKLIIILVFIVLWAGWLIGFPYYLMWLEGISLFTTLPDFTSVHFHFPDDVFRYAGSFILQFYKNPAAAAAIHTAFPMLCILCWWAIVKRLFKNPDTLLWIVFLPLPAILYFLENDMDLGKSCMVVALSATLAAVAAVVSLFVKNKISLPDFMHKTWLSIAVPAVCTVLSLVFIYTGPINTHYDELAELEYLARKQKWDKVLEKVPPKEAKANLFKRKYALLALSETGRLAYDAFRYSLSGPDDFYFQKPVSPLTFNYNMLFYQHLGMENPLIMLAYQQETLSKTGLSFGAARTMADAYIRLKDYDLAKKYIDILSHSTCHHRWVRERISQLEAIRDVEPEYPQVGPRFIMQDFFVNMSSMVSRYPEDRKIADYLLCGVLAQKDGNKFYEAFSIIAEEQYPDGKGLPRLYQEALCPISKHVDGLLQKYHIDDEVWEKFVDFNNLMNSGKSHIAKRRYADTYWAYVFF